VGFDAAGRYDAFRVPVLCVPSIRLPRLAGDASLRRPVAKLPVRCALFTPHVFLIASMSACGYSATSPQEDFAMLRWKHTNRCKTLPKIDHLGNAVASSVHFR
jgi:hypothetical protein